MTVHRAHLISRARMCSGPSQSNAHRVRPARIDRLDISAFMGPDQSSISLEKLSVFLALIIVVGNDLISGRNNHHVLQNSPLDSDSSCLYCSEESHLDNGQK